MTAKPAQPTNAPSPCAVISAYQEFASMRPTPAWLSRISTPSSPDAQRITVEAIR